MAKRHALLSPSSTDCWFQCHGAPALYKDILSVSSDYADEGNCAHEIGDMGLSTGRPASSFIGHEAYGFTCDDEMAKHVQAYIDTVRQYMTHPTDELHVEVELDISEVTGEQDAVGTSDAVILSHVNQEITVGDLKYGRGYRVKAVGNRQARVYALAVLNKYDLIGDWKTIRIVIIQPRAGGVSEWIITVDELRAFGAEVAAAGAHALSLLNDPAEAVKHLSPSDSACKWCRAKADCPALRADILNEFSAIDDHPIEDRPNLGELLGKVDLIEDWCRAIRHEAERRLKLGIEVSGYKLVEGKRGNRAWESEKTVEAVFKSMRVKHDEMYDYKVISPTKAEKLLAKEHPKQWARIQAHITQKAGSPTVAPESDPRPPIPVAVHCSTEFDAIES